MKPKIKNDSKVKVNISKDEVLTDASVGSVFFVASIPFCSFSYQASWMLNMYIFRDRARICKDNIEDEVSKMGFWALMENKTTKTDKLVVLIIFLDSGQKNKIA